MRSWKLVVVLFSVVLACGEVDEPMEESFTKPEACDMAAHWVESHTITLDNAYRSDNAEVTDCGAFRTIQSKGEGTIEVDIFGVFTFGGDPRETEVETELLCGLLEYDQGWEVTECIPN